MSNSLTPDGCTDAEFLQPLCDLIINLCCCWPFAGMMYAFNFLWGEGQFWVKCANECDIWKTTEQFDWGRTRFPLPLSVYFSFTKTFTQERNEMKEMSDNWRFSVWNILKDSVLHHWNCLHNEALSFPPHSFHMRKKCQPCPAGCVKGNFSSIKPPTF